MFRVGGGYFNRMPHLHRINLVRIERLRGELLECAWPVSLAVAQQPACKAAEDKRRDHSGRRRHLPRTRGVAHQLKIEFRGYRLRGDTGVARADGVSL